MEAMRLLLSTTLAIVALLGLACSTDHVAQVDPPTTMEEALYPSGASRNANWNLVQERVQQCMTSSGFKYRPIDGAAVLADRPVAPTLLGLLAIEDPEVDGLSYAGKSQIMNSEDDPNFDVLKTLSSAETTAWHDSARECRSRAWTEINGEWEAVIQPIRQEWRDLEARIAADSRTIAIEEAWAACMQRNGYPFITSVISLVEHYSSENARFIDSSVARMAADREQALNTAEDIQLASLIENEQQAATRAQQCLEDHADDYTDVRATYEARFAYSLEDLPALPTDSGF